MRTRPAQDVNAPAIAAYRAMGFELCGLDRLLYRSTPAEGETALFMARELAAAGECPGNPPS